VILISMRPYCVVTKTGNGDKSVRWSAGGAFAHYSARVVCRASKASKNAEW